MSQILSIGFCLFFVSGVVKGTVPLRMEVEKYLEGQLVGYEKVDFEIVSAPKIQLNENINIDYDRQFKLTGNMAYVPVKISLPGGLSTQALVSVRVKLYKTVLIAKINIRTGGLLRDYNFQLKQADISQLRGNVVNDTSMLMGSKARFGINEGDILTKEAIQPLPLIKSGMRVTAFYSTGNVTVTMGASARQDGYQGDLIRILTQDKKLFRAKIIDINSVIIEE
ncbi:MAG: flagellar basal body P-ring formation chaperone FlgA [Ignavibacteria bacterium]